jgi:KaiC/GvpD/RAD55 family RecA-like ATPase
MSVLLQLMLNGLLRKDIWHANRAAIEMRVVGNNNIATLVSYIDQLHRETDDDLTSLDLLTIIESKLGESERADELVEIVLSLGAAEARPFEAVQPRIADYFARELAAKAIEYVGTRMDSEKFDIQVPLTMLQQAAELATGVDLGVESMSDAPPPERAAERQGVATVGLGPRMDGHLGGGVADGEMQIWLAPPAAGKTSLLLNQGVKMAKDGEHVLHISLEINKAKCRQRVDQALTGMSRDDRIANPMRVVEARKGLVGELYIKDWSGHNVTVADIRTLVKNMRATDRPVTAVVVDYLELMAPTKNNRNGERFNHSQTAKELRRLGNELGVKVVTAWQVNRAGADKHVIGATDVSECWDIVKHADIILGLNHNEVERDNHVLRVNIIKQRESTARPIEYYYADMDRMVIYQKEPEYDGEIEAIRAGNRSGLREHGRSLEAPE